MQAAILVLFEQMGLCPPGLSNENFRGRVAKYGTSALRLVDDSLFLARAESQMPQLVPMYLALLLADAIDDVWPQAHAKGVTLGLFAEPGKTVLRDVQLLRRGFQNLLSNAIK
jgi:signal transduction histidine kinase